MAQGTGGVGGAQGQAGNKNSMTSVLKQRVAGNKDKISDSFKQGKPKGVGFNSVKSSSSRSPIRSQKVDVRA